MPGVISKTKRMFGRMIHWIYAQLALIGSGLFFIFALASYIKTPWFLPELFSHFQLQLFLACGLVFSILILLARATPAAVYVLLTAALALYTFNLAPYMNFSRLLPGQPLDKQVAVHPERTYSLLQANLFKFNFKYEPMIALIKQTRPDILVVYEMTADWQAALDNLSEMFPHALRQADEGSHGIALYSRYPLENMQTLYMAGDRVPAQIARVMLPQGAVKLVSLHTRPPTRQGFYVNRNQHFDWLKQNLFIYRDEPLIVVGDLNTTMFAPQYKHMMRKTGLQNARRGRGLQNSWFLHNNLLTGIPIDHFLHNERIHILESSVTPTIKSDHLPLITYFEITAR